MDCEPWGCGGRRASLPPACAQSRRRRARSNRHTMGRARAHEREAARTLRSGFGEFGCPPPGRKCQPTPPRPGSCPHTRPYPGVRPITPPPRAVNRAYDGVARQARAIISARKLIIDEVRARTRGTGGAPQAPLLPLPVINGSCGAGCGGAAAGRTRKGRNERNVERHGHGEHPTPEITKCRHTSPRRLRRPRFFDARQRTGDPPAYAGAQGSTRRGGGTRRQRNLMPSGDSSQLFLLFLSPAPDKFWIVDLDRR